MRMRRCIECGGKTLTLITRCGLSLLQIILQVDSYLLTVADQKDKLFRFASLEKYSLWQRTMIRLADLAFYSFISILGATLRIEIDGEEHLDAILDAGKVPIFTFWHDRILLFTYKFRGQG